MSAHQAADESVWGGIMILWEEVPEDTYITSDRHYGDPDEKTRDRFGNCGHDLWIRALLGLTHDSCLEASYAPDIKKSSVICAGDFLNYPSRRMLLKILNREVRLPGIVLAGNHDSDMTGAWRARYRRGNNMLCGDKGNTFIIHGDGAQTLWDKNKKIARRSVGQWVVRLGDAMEQVVPWSDNVITGAAGRVASLPFLIPRGWKDNRETYLDWATKKLVSSGCKTLVHGHTHVPGVFVWSAVTNAWGTWSTDLVWEPIYTPLIAPELPDKAVVVDTGSWMPCHRRHPQGWSEKGDVSPYMYGVNERTLYRVCPDGLEVMMKCPDQ